ncbi:carbonic anhydrase 3-like [Parasteatoda tepidariorum]|uniref:carbonic anhydrase 3-like n=1 Tax=Parasteatoda tepidariorum TaxID=114398 RepID=UPI001C71F721|nr:carbonic anhydrase 3-like [Parasteatoda tepidariorum]
MQLMILITVFWCIISSLHISRTSAQDCPADKDKSWSYNPNFSNGPSHWSELYPNCKGKSQSPISIVTEHVSNRKDHLKWELNGYQIPLYNMKIENNGHASKIIIEKTQ